jgi:cadmium resistance protein CadD (predicted permease)
VVLTALFLSSRAAGLPRARSIWLGQYLGLDALVAASAAAALGLAVVSASSASVAGSRLGVAGVTVANGADNVAVYTPAFRTAGTSGWPVILAVFAVGVAAWVPRRALARLAPGRGARGSAVGAPGWCRRCS